MRKIFALLFLVLFSNLPVLAKEYHVSKAGNDANPGTKTKPFRTINFAAQMAMSGDVITVHEGVYRERVNPARGGSADTMRIVYRAAKGEKVEIRGSEQVKNWTEVKPGIWKVSLPNTFFGDFNPYSDVIHGDWYDDKGWTQHTGAVYLDGKWMMEAPRMEKLDGSGAGEQLWFATVDKDSTRIWAALGTIDPARHKVEINVRQTVFYPSRTRVNYLTVSGFVMKHAATPWAPPTAEQRGLIGTNWSKGWIIENNEISYSKCSGISLGKYGDCYDNTSQNSAEGYVETVRRALMNGWNKQTVGSHIVRNNLIFCCEQAGIVGSLGCSFSQVTGNTIHDVHMKRLFSGAEMGAIKFHGAVDMEISHNHLYHNNRGIWLDWMAQGTRLSGNLMLDNDDWDIYFEVDHGPVIMDNNISLSPNSQRIWMQGGAYIHNLIAGRIEVCHYDGRETPVLKPHDTEIMNLADNLDGDMRFYNNLFIGKACNLSVYDHAVLPVTMKGNSYMDGAKPSVKESEPLISATASDIKLNNANDRLTLEITLPTDRKKSIPVKSGMLGVSHHSKQKFNDPEGKPINFNRDYFNTKRSKDPVPGPFESSSPARLKIDLQIDSLTN